MARPPPQGQNAGLTQRAKAGGGCFRGPLARAKSACVTATTASEPAGAEEAVLAPELLVRIYEVMLRSRCLEERLIRMNKQGDGFFWIGGAGGGAPNGALGVLGHQGQGGRVRYV